MIQKKLIQDISSFYLNKEYEVIDYLYHELFYDKKSSKEEYQVLLDSISNHYSNEVEKLMDIVSLYKKNISFDIFS